MTELALHQPVTNLSEQMDYARAVSTASLLPSSYRGKPADIMLAVGLGQSMGLSPAESLYRIDVIQGKPTASAELIAANVRKAGHKLRVRLDEQATSATATIIRADDPEFEHVVVRDMKWARDMGLVSKDNYKKQPLTMLQHRAVTAVARLACPEALYGVAYTADEMYDMPGNAPRQGGLAAALAEDVTPQPPDTEEPADEPHDAEIVEDDPITAAQLKKLQTVLSHLSMDRDSALAFYASTTGRNVDSSKALTKDEAGRVIDGLEALEGGAA